MINHKICIFIRGKLSIIRCDSKLYTKNEYLHSWVSLQTEGPTYRHEHLWSSLANNITFGLIENMGK